MHGKVKKIKYLLAGSRGGKSAIPFQDPTIIQLAEKYKRTPAQVLLRYLLQLGCIVIPKSVKMMRIVENFNVYGFELSPLDMRKIEKLDRGTAGKTFFLNFLPTDQDPKALAEYPDCEADNYDP